MQDVADAELNVYALPSEAYEQSTDQCVAAFRGIYGSYKAYRREMMLLKAFCYLIYPFCKIALVFLWFAERSPIHFFDRVEQMSKRLLPARILSEAFEPAFEDEKGTFLKKRTSEKSKCSQFLLYFQLRLRVIGLFLCCYWLLCKDIANAMLVGAILKFIKKALGV